MPQIQQYEAPQGTGLNPTETGINATAGAARRLQGDYSEKAAAITGEGRRIASAVEGAGDEAVKYLDHQQISAGTAHAAKIADGITKAWDATLKDPNLDPNDPAVAAKFRAETLEPALDKFKEGFTTEKSQAWAEHYADSYREHMFHKTAADMSTLAKEATKVNYTQTANSLSNMVRSDPSSMDFSLDAMKHSVDGLIASSNMSGADAATFRSEALQHGNEAIIKSAALGGIEKNGEIPDWVSDPKYSKYINGAELKQFASAAKYYQSQIKSMDRAQRVEADYTAKKNFNADINKLELSTVDQETGLPIVSAAHFKKLNEIVQNNPDGAALEPGRVRQMQEGLNAAVRRMNQAQAPRDISRTTANELLTRIGADDDTRIKSDSEIMARSENMRDSDYRMVMNAYKHSQTDDGRLLARTRNEFFKDHALAIDPSFGGTDEGLRKVFFAKQEALRQEDVLRKQSKDPNLVYDNRSEYYFGAPENLKRFKASLTDLMKSAPKKEDGGPDVAVPQVGARKEFKQGWGVWNGKTYVPEGAK